MFGGGRSQHSAGARACRTSAGTGECGPPTARARFGTCHRPVHYLRVRGAHRPASARTRPGTACRLLAFDLTVHLRCHFLVSLTFCLGSQSLLLWLWPCLSLARALCVCVFTSLCVSLSNDVPLVHLDAHSEGCLTKLIDFSVRKATRSQPPSPSSAHQQRADARRGPGTERQRDRVTGAQGGADLAPPPVARRPPPQVATDLLRPAVDERPPSSYGHHGGGAAAAGGSAAAASRSRSSANREHRAQRMEASTGWLGSPPQTRSPQRRGGSY